MVLTISDKNKSIIVRMLIVGSFEAVMYVLGEAASKSYGFGWGILIMFVANALIYLGFALEARGAL